MDRSQRIFEPRDRSAAGVALSRDFASLPRRAAHGLIRFYQLSLSALIGRQCRHWPSCSDYTDQAIQKHGLWAGGWIGCARICRCGPGGTSGIDLVCEAVPPSARWWLPWRYGRWRGVNAPPPLDAADRARIADILEPQYRSDAVSTGSTNDLADDRRGATMAPLYSAVDPGESREAFPRMNDEQVVELHKEHVEAGLADGSILLVDVREAHEFAAGHIPGSVSMPLSTFDPSAIPHYEDKQIVFSCAAGIRSLRALEFVQAAGLDLDRHYVGGFKDWVMSGGPVER